MTLIKNTEVREAEYAYTKPDDLEMYVLCETSLIDSVFLLILDFSLPSVDNCSGSVLVFAYLSSPASMAALLWEGARLPAAL